MWIIPFFPLLSVNVYCNKEKSGFYHTPSIYFLKKFQCTFIVVLELLTDIPVRNNFSSYSTVVTYS